MVNGTAVPVYTTKRKTGMWYAWTSTVLFARGGTHWKNFEPALNKYADYQAIGITRRDAAVQLAHKCGAALYVRDDYTEVSSSKVLYR
ncbi:MAG: hypothetical protein ACXABY_11660 [Candidatus Thorarchaeota archaeon]